MDISAMLISSLDILEKELRRLHQLDKHLTRRYPEPCNQYARLKHGRAGDKDEVAWQRPTRNFDTGHKVILHTRVTPNTKFIPNTRVISNKR